MRVEKETHQSIANLATDLSFKHGDAEGTAKYFADLAFLFEDKLLEAIAEMPDYAQWCKDKDVAEREHRLGMV